jgi:hypothetical protein
LPRESNQKLSWYLLDDICRAAFRSFCANMQN